MPMTQFVKQSDIIDAIQNPDPENQDTVATPKWIVEAFMSGRLTQNEKTGVVTNHHEDAERVEAQVGDWLIMRNDGGLEILSAEDFQATYVPIAANLHRV